MKKNNKYSKVRVLLVEGRARQVMPLMESLKKMGCYIVTYCSSKLDMGYSSHYPNKKILSYCDVSNPQKTYESIKKAAIDNKIDIIIPLNDYPAILLSRNKHDIKTICDVAVNDWEIFQYASDKLKTMAACTNHKIPCPQTIFDLDALLKGDISIKYPLIIKPRTAYGAQGLKIVNNIEELKDSFINIEKEFGPCFVQEFIPQTDLQYKAEIYVDKKGDVKSCCVFAKVRWYPLNGGSSTLNITVQRDDIVKTCVKLIKTIGWKGYADVDLIHDPRDNVAKVMEINPRITGSVKICYKSGINFSEQIIQDHLNLPVNEQMEYRIGTRLRYLHTDLLWFFASKERFRCKPSWFNFFNQSDQIWSIKDPIPWFTYTLGSIRTYMKIKRNKRR